MLMQSKVIAASLLCIKGRSLGLCVQEQGISIFLSQAKNIKYCGEVGKIKPRQLGKQNEGILTCGSFRCDVEPRPHQADIKLSQHYQEKEQGHHPNTPYIFRLRQHQRWLFACEYSVAIGTSCISAVSTQQYIFDQLGCGLRHLEVVEAAESMQISFFYTEKAESYRHFRLLLVLGTQVPEV